MRDDRSLAHTRWDCKYRVVFIPKYRKKVIDGDLRSHLGEIFHELAESVAALAAHELEYVSTTCE